MSNAMKVPVFNRWKGWIIGLLLPLVVGCSAVRVTYGQGPLLAYWWLDNQLDFSSEQAPRVKAALADWFGWHRATQLPDYAQALAELAVQVRGDLTPAQVCSQVEAWQRRAERAVDRAAPAVAEQLRGLSAAQLNHLEKRQADKLKEAQAEHLQNDLAERQEAVFKRQLDRAETFYGSLDAPQRQLLAAGLAASPYDPERWLAERRARSADLLRHLRQWQAEGTDSATVQAGVRRLAAEVATSPRPAYLAYSRQLQQANCALVARLHNSTSTAQRQKAASRLQGWQDDLRTLADSR